MLLPQSSLFRKECCISTCLSTHGLLRSARSPTTPRSTNRLSIPVKARSSGVDGQSPRVAASDDPTLPPEKNVWLERIQRVQKPTARSAALEQLLRIQQDGAFAGLVSRNAIDTTVDDSANDVSGSKTFSKALPDRDRRQVTDLVGGVTRWQRRIDYVLTNLPKPTNLRAMEPPLQIILRMGAYELIELKRPPHMTNEYVELAKLIMHDGCAKVVNGVLRSISREKDSGQLPAPPPPANPNDLATLADAMAIAFSHPTWMVKRWLRQFGVKATAELLKRNNNRPRYTVRVAPGWLTTEQLEDDFKEMFNADVHQSEYLPNEFLHVATGLQSLIGAGLLKKGQLQVQDEAAGLVVALLDPQPGEMILDACAAPGGKAMFAAARMQGKGLLVAADASLSRLKAVEKAAANQGWADFVQSFAVDLRQYNSVRQAYATQDGPNSDLDLPPVFDKVLLDAPCTGTGVLAKRADLRWRKSPEELQQLCALQKELLAAAAPLVRHGGVLVYSTCSLEPEENHNQIQWFVEQYPEFQVEPALEVEGVPHECVTDEGYLQMLPHVHGTDGAFAARLRKASAE